MNMYILAHISLEQDEKFIGVFSSKKKAEDIIREYKKKDGFVLNPNGFILNKIDVLENLKMKDGIVLYMIISYIWDETEEEEKNIKYYGVFLNLSKKDIYMNKYRNVLDDNVILDVQEVILNKGFWDEGFITV